MSKKVPLTSEEVAGIEARRRIGAEGTLYDMLGVHPGQPIPEIEAAYHEFVRRWHPDRFFSRDVGDLRQVIDESFVHATRAFRTLRDPPARAAYDRELKVQGRWPGTPPRKTEDRAAEDRRAEDRRANARTQPIPPDPITEERPGHTVVITSDRFERRPAPPPPPPPVKPRLPKAVEQARDAIRARLTKAKEFYDAGKAEFDAGNYAKAEGSLYLATKYDDKNEVYQALLKQATTLAGEQRAKTYVQQAEAAEQQARGRDAMALYRKAVECNPPEGTAYYKLAMLARADDGNAREVLTLLREATRKDPTNLKYRLALARQYAEINLVSSAMREVTTILQAEPKNEDAKALQKKLKAAS
jgi:curved DNA-binding protein CbpA